MSSSNCEDQSSDIPSWSTKDHEDDVAESRLKCMDVEITISGTKIVKNKILRNHTAYIIEVTLGLQWWVVERSFDDFIFLHQQVVKYFSDSSEFKEFIPMLPPRRISERIFGGSSTKIQVNEDRRQKLAIYLEKLIALPPSWDGNDLVQFLDNKHHSLMFTWNVDRMRKVQHILNSMMIFGDDTFSATLSTEFQDAQQQILRLKEKISGMEMLFLQQAAGVASEKLSRETITALALTEAAVRSSIDSLSSERISELDSDSALGSAQSDNGIRDSVIVNEMVAGAVGAGNKLSIEEVVRAVGLAMGRHTADSPRQAKPASFGSRLPDLSKESLLTTFSQKIYRAASWPPAVEDVRSYALAVKIQEALRLGQVLDGAQAVFAADLKSKSSSTGSDIQTQSFSSAVSSSAHARETLASKLGGGGGGTDSSRSAQGEIDPAAELELLKSRFTGNVASLETSAAAEAGAAPGAAYTPLSAPGSTDITSPADDNGTDITALKRDVTQNFSSGSWLEPLQHFVDSLIASLVPTMEEQQSRHKVFRFLRDQVASTMGVQLFPFGGFVSGTFLPGGEVDVVLFSVKSEDENWYVRVNEMLCIASFGSAGRLTGLTALAGSSSSSSSIRSSLKAGSSSGKNGASGGGSGGGGGGGNTKSNSNSSSNSSNRLSMDALNGGDDGRQSEEEDLSLIHAKVRITNVAFVNADVKLVSCSVDGITVNMTVNNISGLYTQAFLLAIDEHIDQQHLFKRSVLLLKAWCYFESAKYTNGNGRIVGPKEGRLSAWSTIVMLVWIFNKYGAEISHPIQALCRFLRYYADFDWDNFAITVHGPVSAVDLTGAVAISDVDVGTDANGGDGDTGVGEDVTAAAEVAPAVTTEGDGDQTRSPKQTTQQDPRGARSQTEAKTGPEVAEGGAPYTYLPVELLNRYAIRYERAHDSSVRAFDLTSGGTGRGGGFGAGAGAGVAGVAGDPKSGEFGPGTAGGARGVKGASDSGQKKNVSTVSSHLLPNNWGAKLAFSKGFEYRRGLINIMDPAATRCSLCGYVDLVGLRAVTAALKGGHTALQACLATSRDSLLQARGRDPRDLTPREGKTGTSSAGHAEIVATLFGNTLEKMLTRTPQTLPASASGGGGGEGSASGGGGEKDAENVEVSGGLLSHSKVVDPLASQLDEAEASLQYAELVLGSVVKQGALVQVVMQTLNQKGTMSIGEAGKYLHRLTQSDVVTKRLKDQFGGLKRAVEASGSPYLTIVDNHQFNPTIELSQAGLALRRGLEPPGDPAGGALDAAASTVLVFNNSTFLLPPIPSPHANGNADSTSVAGGWSTAGSTAASGAAVGEGSSKKHQHHGGQRRQASIVGGGGGGGGGGGLGMMGLKSVSSDSISASSVSSVSTTKSMRSMMSGKSGGNAMAHSPTAGQIARGSGDQSEYPRSSHSAGGKGGQRAAVGQQEGGFSGGHGGHVSEEYDGANPATGYGPPGPPGGPLVGPVYGYTHGYGPAYMGGPMAGHLGGQMGNAVMLYPDGSMVYGHVPGPFYQHPHHSQHPQAYPAYAPYPAVMTDEQKQPEGES